MKHAFKHFCMIALLLSVSSMMLYAQTNTQKKKKMGPMQVMGNWKGEFTSTEWKDKTIRAKIVVLTRNAPQSRDDYRGVFFIGSDNAGEQRVEIIGRLINNEAVFQGDAVLPEDLGGRCKIFGVIAPGGGLKGKIHTYNKMFPFELKKVKLQSPTMGKNIPQGAIQLLPNEPKSTGEGQALLEKYWNIQNHWTLQKDGAVRITASGIQTKQEFGDAIYHIEFQTPFMPDDRGQRRGNSGVYIQNRYEVQVLDSFGDIPQDNLCGGIYKFAVPLADVCLPPLEWQTYDIVFLAPRFDSDGNKTSHAKISVKHNGTLIHDRLVLDYASKGLKKTEKSAAGPLLLQDHAHDKVGYRNIWVQMLSSIQEGEVLMKQWHADVK